MGQPWSCMQSRGSKYAFDDGLDEKELEKQAQVGLTAVSWLLTCTQRHSGTL